MDFKDVRPPGMSIDDSKAPAEEKDGLMMGANKTSVVYDRSFGCAFAGGGIRSASFVSGVLSAMISADNAEPIHQQEFGGQANKEEPDPMRLPRAMPKFFSCVSGGGYIGSSFLYWARVMRGKHPQLWRTQYFSSMRRRVSFLVDFQSVFGFVRDSVAFITTVLATLAIFLAWQLPLYYLTALIVSGSHVHTLTNNVLNYQGGEVLVYMLLGLVGTIFVANLARNRFVSVSLTKLKSFMVDDDENRRVPTEANVRYSRVCANVGEIAFRWVFLISLTCACLIVMEAVEMLNVLARHVCDTNLHLPHICDEAIWTDYVLAQIVFGFLLYVSLTKGLLIPCAGSMVAGWLVLDTHEIPLHYTTANTTSQTVFETTNEKWITFETFCCISYLLLPVTQILKDRLFFEFYRNKLEQTFYNIPMAEDDPKRHRPSYFNCLRFSLCPKGMDKRALLTLPDEKQQDDDLPVYLANTTVNHWLVLKRPDFRQFDRCKSDVQRTIANEISLQQLTSAGSFDLLVLSSQGWWERYETNWNAPLIYHEPQRGSRQKVFAAEETTLPPPNSEMSLGVAMCTSAAAGGLQNGALGDSGAFLHLQTSMGLSIGKMTATNNGRVIGFLLCFGLHAITALPICLSLLYDHYLPPPEDGTTSMQRFGFISGVAIIVLSICIPLIDFKWPQLMVTTRFPLATHFKNTLRLPDWSRDLPSSVYLSDGAHTDNFALLPLLHRRLPFIVCALAPESPMCVMELCDTVRDAESKLGVRITLIKNDCKRRGLPDNLSFYDGVQTFACDLFCRVMVLRIHYPAIRTSDAPGGEGRVASTGYLFFLKPIPDKITKRGRDIVEDSCRECYDYLEPPLSHDNLYGCCCSRVHHKKIKCCRNITGPFPYIPTAFQAITPEQFDGFHVEGFAAMKEAMEIDLSE